jgi:hypothetical protein
MRHLEIVKLAAVVAAQIAVATVLLTLLATFLGYALTKI